MIHNEMAQHTKALEEIATEGFSAIERAYEDAMAHIASLAEGATVPVESMPDRSAAHDAPTVEVAAQAA